MMPSLPGKSAIDAVRQARQRCLRYDWVLDLDVKGYVDLASYCTVERVDET